MTTERTPVSKDTSSPEGRIRNFVISVLTTTAILLFVAHCTSTFGYFPNDKGQVGDFFNGIVGPVLSFFTIILLYRSYTVQKSELEKTTVALNKSIAETKTSHQLTLMSDLKNTVFRFIDRYESAKDEFTISYQENITVSGKRALRSVIWELMSNEKIKTLLEDKNQNISSEKSKKELDEALQSAFIELSREYYYDDLSKMVYKFIVIYGFLLESSVPPASLNTLRVAINQISDEEFFIIKLFVNQLDDLEELRSGLGKFHIVSTSEHLYTQYLLKFGS